MTDQVRREEGAESELQNTLLDAADAPAAEAAPQTPEQTAEGAAEPTPEPEAAAPVADATAADQTSEAPAAPVAETAEPEQPAQATTAGDAAGEGEAASAGQSEAATSEAPAAEVATSEAPAAEAATSEAPAAAEVATSEAPAAAEVATSEAPAAEAATSEAPAAEAASEGASFTPVAEEGGTKPRRLKDLQGGMELEGKVTSIALYGIFVDVGVGRDGLVHISEMSDTRIDTPSDLVQIGDVVKVKVKSVDLDARRISLTMRTGERNPEASRGRSRGPKRSEVDKDKLANLKVGDVVEGTITGFAPFGAFADIGVGKDGLIHVSELADGRVEKPEDAVKVGDKHTFKVIEIAPEGTRISLSLRKALRSQKMQQLEPGTILDGTVSGIAPFGAFVDIGVGRDGLVHISALSNQRVGKVEDVVKVGDKVQVKVLEVDQQSKRISLTMRLDDTAESAAEAAEEYDNSAGSRGPSARMDTSRYAAAAQAARERGGERSERGGRGRGERRPSQPPVNESYSSADYEEEFTGDATLEDLLSKFGGPSNSRRDVRKGREDAEEEPEVEEGDNRQSRRQRDAIRRTLQQVGRDE